MRSVLIRVQINKDHMNILDNSKVDMSGKVSTQHLFQPFDNLFIDPIWTLHSVIYLNQFSFKLSFVEKALVILLPRQDLTIY